ncbi:liver-enriched gene 1, tandem duplicate 1 [Misgurnus anguillicaudatus]|uniref:liver-enriched gene 1, tandem duplicate 1 n=1 Tax=Misgurnus anguillicaudatus TaxID=75329 RepID=UPI003CCFB34C
MPTSTNHRIKVLFPGINASFQSTSHQQSELSRSPKMYFIWTTTSVLLLALVCEAAVVTENGFPIQWEKSPSELSQLEDGQIHVNPWDYLQRMGLYKVLINSTNPYMSSMGPGITENPLWSLPLQLGWKLRSGRLTDPTPSSISTCGLESSEPVCISPHSWYGCINYYMSVLPFLAAVHSGVVEQDVNQIHIKGPADVPEDYCTSFTQCSTNHNHAMNTWQTYFQSLRLIHESEDTDFNKKDRILGLLWAAEEKTLQTVSFACSERKKLYSSPEVRFGQNWLNSAAYVAAAHFHGNIERTEKLMSPLPSRVLQENDSPPNISDLSTEENHTLSILNWINRINQVLGGSLVYLWRRAMCSPQTREKGQALLYNLILDPKFETSSLITILREMSSSC